MNDLDEKYFKIIKDIVAKYIKNARVVVFGSRVNGKNTHNSDLDIAIIADEKLDFKTMANIKMDIEESPIPFRVDIVDYNAVSDEFKRIIDTSCKDI